MITSITFQFKYNKNYLAPELMPTQKVYGIRSTIDLQTELAEDVLKLTKMYAIVTLLNADLRRANIREAIRKFCPNESITVTAKTSKKRTYFIHGLTIHEEDK